VLTHMELWEKHHTTSSHMDWNGNKMDGLFTLLNNGSAYPCEIIWSHDMNVIVQYAIPSVKQTQTYCTIVDH